MSAPRRVVHAVVASLALALAGMGAADVPLAAVQAGLTGFGLTEGPSGIERFDVEVLGLQYDPAGGYPLVLVRTSGAVIDAAGGVAAGMSGSPVYVNVDGVDELLGAVGFVFPESDGALALVTPIAAMRDVLRDVRTSLADPIAPPALAALGPAVPVASPVLVDGLGPRALEFLEPLWALGLRPMPSYGGSGALGAAVRSAQTDAQGADAVAEADVELGPGSAISLQLARGDVTVAALGTLTLVETGEFLALGHPLLGVGPIEYALAPAFVTAFVPSRVVPFKLANSGTTTRGAVHLDRQAGLAGVLDAEPDLLPVRLTLRNAEGAAAYDVDLARHARLTPALLAAVVAQALDVARGAVVGGSATLSWNLDLGGERLALIDDVSDPDDLARAVARSSARPLAILLANPFENPTIERIDLLIETTAERRDASLVDVDLAQDELVAEATAEVFVRLQPYRRQAIVETLEVPLPDELSADLAPGERREVRMLVRGGNAPRPDLGDAARRAQEPPILSYGELLEALRSEPRGDELVVEVVIDDEWRRLERLRVPYVVDGSKEVLLIVTAPDDPGGDDTDADPDATNGTASEGTDSP